MRTLTFTYGHEEIFQDVLQESSLLAERTFGSDGSSLFESTVFDEEYSDLFRLLFLDARSYVTPALSAYLKGVPEQAYDTEDYTLTLAMPDRFNFHLSKSVDDKIRQFIIAYIMYRWLETKLPEQALTYLARADRAISGARHLLDQRTEPAQRRGWYW